MNKTKRGLVIIPPFLTMIALWIVGIVTWFRTGDPLGLIFFFYVGILVGMGIGGYIAAPDRDRPQARQIVILMMGGLLLMIAFISDHGNMQIEGFFFALLGGTGSFIIIHYLIAKVVGPLIFGRVWCGWACWYGMVFDMLPYAHSRYRHDSKWGRLRLVHFGLSLGAVALLVVGFGYQRGALGTSGMLWFVVGLLSYYALGVGMALVLKDNRAFCKYLCPLTVPLKAASQFSLLKVEAKTDEYCEGCEACVEMCPMNIRVKDYVLQGERVLSTECTMCQTCISCCPHDSLTLSIGFDRGGKEIYDYEPPKRRT